MIDNGFKLVYSQGMVYGFSGTHTGMREPQLRSLEGLLIERQVTTIHHGDCIGSDEELDALAHRLRIGVELHPPTDEKLRAHCVNAQRVWSPQPYLVRDLAIARCGVDGLIATPKNRNKPLNLRGQGTWTTIGYAKKLKRRVWLVFPDGQIVEV